MVEDNNPAQNSEGQEGRPEHSSTYQGDETITLMSKVSHNEGGTDSPPPVYTVSPPAYVAPPEYINNETVVIGDSPPLTPGSMAGEMRKEQLPPSYHQLFPSTLAAPLPPIEIVPTHAMQTHAVQ